MTGMTGASNLQGGVVSLDDDPDEGVIADVGWNMEVGRTGLRRAGGYIDEEFLPALRGRKAVQVFREMGDNDPIAGSLLFSLTRLIAEVTWRMEPASDKPEDRQISEFVEECMGDMTHSFSEFMIEALSCLQYGWSWHEMCFKKRLGPWYTNAKNNNLHRSKYNDGKIGFAKLPIRSQESLLRWRFGPFDEVTHLIQMPAPTYEMRTVPYSKSLLFRPSAPKGNPEGFSILRRAYRPWYMKKRIEEYEAIGVERDLAGLPMGKIPAAILAAKPGTKEMQELLAWKKLVKNIRRDEQDGVLIPSAFDQNNNPKYDFSLLTSGGSRQFDTNGIIERYALWMLMQVLADFILVGHQDGGSYNLHTDKTGLFKTACNSFAQLMADEFNRKAVPMLLKVNGLQPDELPKLVPSQVDSPDITQLGAFMTQMAGLGIQWFPDPKMEAFVRNAADLPELDKAQEKFREQQARQAQIVQAAAQRLQALQIQQQAAQGQQQVQQGDQQVAQGAMATASQAAELAKPGSTAPPGPPNAGGSRRPPVKAAGRKVAAKPGKSNAPAAAKRKTVKKVGQR